MDEFYEKIKEEIKPILYYSSRNHSTQTLNFILWGQHYPDTKTSQRHYKKTINRCSSWTQMQKFKIKTLANTIQYIKRQIPHDYFKFIPQMEGWFNISKLINVIYHINKSKNAKLWLSQKTQKNHSMIFIHD